MSTSKQLVERFHELTEQQKKIAESATPQKFDEYSRQRNEIDPDLLREWRTKALHLLKLACGEDSEHYTAFSNTEISGYYSTYLDSLTTHAAIFRAAREDYERGLMTTVRALVQAEVFDSQLEQAEELERKGHSVAAAVIAGVVLETTLRELCEKEGLGTGKLDKMNADLAKAGAYTVLTQKKITSLAGIRNAAAHGDIERFDAANVPGMIADVRSFVEQQQ